MRKQDVPRDTTHGQGGSVEPPLAKDGQRFEGARGGIGFSSRREGGVETTVNGGQLPGRPRRRLGTWKVVLLGLLAVLVGAGGIAGVWWWGMGGKKGVLPGGAVGPFVRPPLSNEQVDDIQHLLAHMKYKQLASLYVAKMSLDEELGQLLMVQYRSGDYSTDLDTMINQQYVGGVIMYAGQLQTVEQAKQDTAHMQGRAKIPLFIGIDQEGWNVCRLCGIYPDHYVRYVDDAQDIRKTGDPTAATREGHKVAQDMLALGINVNFAPDVDVANDDTSYIGYDYRSFGDNAADVIKYAGPYMEALQGDGIIACLKHFPGLGSVPRGFDPHGVLPTVTETKEQLKQSDLIPFKHFIESNNGLDRPGFIMPTDELVPAVDPTYPAEFSHVFMTDILRKEMGYDGVAISDSVIMGGVQVNGVQLTQAQASLLAIQAGDDMVLDVDSTYQVTDVINTFKNALQQGTLTKQRVDEAVTRILALKMERHLLAAQPPQ